MRQYIATFFSHFGAVRFQHLCVERGWQAQLRPVPRSLSSSCGTCVRCEEDYLPPDNACREEIEQIAAWDGGGYGIVYHADRAEE